MKTDKHIYPSVHRGIVRAAMQLLEFEEHPSANYFYVSDLETLVEEAAAPDRIGDRHQGRGLHYYLASDPNGTPKPLKSDRYCNGRNMLSPSPRTVLNGEYEAAVMLKNAGYRDAAMRSLSRAIHMLADICCPPHTTGLTYFSRYAMQHKRYEAQAAQLFWGESISVDEEAVTKRWAESAAGEIPEAVFRSALIPEELAEHWDTDSPHPLDRLLNALAKESAKELPAVLSEDDDVRAVSIRKQLTTAIRNAAALLAVYAYHMQFCALGCLCENRPYYLSVIGQKPILKEPLYLHLEASGEARFCTMDGRYLAVTRLGQVVLTSQTQGKIISYRIGSENTTVLYVDGDQNRLIGKSGNRLHCYDRRFYSEVTCELSCNLWFSEDFEYFDGERT